MLDMGEPIKIAYLADQMIRLSGKPPSKDIAIEYMGLRLGEKLYEGLFYASEDLAETTHPKIRVAHRGPVSAPEELARGLEALQVGVQACDKKAMRTALATLIPEWHDAPDGPRRLVIPSGIGSVKMNGLALHRHSGWDPGIQSPGTANPWLCRGAELVLEVKEK